MKKYAILIAVFVMASIPSFAQFPQIPGDPINYSLIRYPHLPGSYPVLMGVEIEVDDMWSDTSVNKDYFKSMINGNHAVTLYYDGELIKTKDISEKMLRSAIDWAFGESGIRDRKHFQQLIDKLNVIIPKHSRRQFWEDLASNASASVGTGLDLVSSTGQIEPPKVGYALMGGKYVYRLARMARGKTTFSEAFLNLDTFGDGVSVALDLGKASARFSSSVGMGLFAVSFWQTFFEAQYEARYTKPALNAAISAAQMLNKFYESANRYLRENSELLKEEKWMIHVNGNASHPFLFGDEKCSFSLRMRGTLDKLWPLDDDSPDAEQRFYKTFEGKYFGWLDATQTCDMSNFDKHYIIKQEGYYTEGSRLDRIAASNVPNSPLGMRQTANEWYNTGKRLKAEEGVDVDFQHVAKAKTAASATYQIPIILKIEAPRYYRKYANVSFHTTEGDEEVAGEYPKMQIEDMHQSYSHEFSFTMGGVKMKQEEKMDGDKMVLIVNGVVERETDNNQTLMTPPFGWITVNLQQSIADGTFNGTK